MYKVRVAVAFEAGHRLMNYSGKCASPHGHSYTAEVFAISESLDELGLSVDFGDLKRRCMTWIESNWDHGFLLNDQDLEMIGALQHIPGVKLYLFSNQNPTAEAMARALHQVTSQFWSIAGVRIWESPSQFAEYT